MAIRYNKTHGDIKITLGVCTDITYDEMKKSVRNAYNGKRIENTAKQKALSINGKGHFLFANKKLK